MPGGHAGGVTPVPISNTEVKPSRADDTAAVRLWESRTLPGLIRSPLIARSAGFFVRRGLCAFKILVQQLAKCMCGAVPVQDFAGSVVEHRLHLLDVLS